MHSLSCYVTWKRKWLVCLQLISLVEKIYFRIQFSDRKIQFKKLLEPLITKPELVAIPKLVLAQFCRGDDLMWSAYLDKNQSSNTVKLSNTVNPQELITNFDKIFETWLRLSFAVQSDLIICYSTSPGNYAVRDSTGSSPFIQAFCNEMKTDKRQNVFQVPRNHRVFNI